MANVNVWEERLVEKSRTAAGEARKVPEMPSGNIVDDVK
jgi:hypothetical protein